MHISFIIVEISKIFGEIGNLVSFIIVGKHKPVRGISSKGSVAGNAWQTQQSQMAQAVSAGVNPAQTTPAAPAAPAAGTKKVTADRKAILVATKTCPNCGAAKKMLEKAHIPYQVIYADNPEGMSFAEANNIIQAPTLLMPNGETYDKYTNIAEISAFMKNRRPVLA